MKAEQVAVSQDSPIIDKAVAWIVSTGLAWLAKRADKRDDPHQLAHATAAIRVGATDGHTGETCPLARPGSVPPPDDSAGPT